MTARPRVRAALGAVALLVAGLDVFIAYGARVTHPVRPAGAWRDFTEQPSYAGLGAYADRVVGPRPAPGVYRYATTGSADLDRLGVTRRYPRTTVRVVRHGPGCEWSETVPILREHVETYSACSTGGDQLDTGFATDLTYFGVPGRSDSRCSPTGSRTGAGRAAGEVSRFRCADRDRRVSTTGTTTYVGRGSVSVDGVARECRQVRIVTVLRGRTEGAAVRELCTDEVTGLVLAEKRYVGLTVQSRFIGLVRYVERAEFRLLSATPHTPPRG